MSTAILEAVEKLSKDLKVASSTLTDTEARYLVDMYYQIQDSRMQTSGQIRSIDKLKTGEPHETLTFFDGSYRLIEKNIVTALDAYVEARPVGRWLKSITGIGPVISAGLMAYIDITKCPTAGHIQSYAGLNPNRDWLGREKATKLINSIIPPKTQITNEHLAQIAASSGWSMDHLIAKCYDENKTKYDRAKLISAVSMKPFNSNFKVLCWKIGESFIKVSNNPKDVYGKLYQVRKAYEKRKNEAGDYADQAKHKIVNYNLDKSKDAYKAYVQGKLPDGHINARCSRYAVKIFLSHVHYAMYLDHYGVEPPKPYAIAILGHAHEIPIPNLEFLK